MTKQAKQAAPLGTNLGVYLPNRSLESMDPDEQVIFLSDFAQSIVDTIWRAIPELASAIAGAAATSAVSYLASAPIVTHKAVERDEAGNIVGVTETTVRQP